MRANFYKIALCKIDLCSFKQVNHLTLKGMPISVAQMRMLLTSFPCLHTMTMYTVSEYNQQTDTEDDPKTGTHDDTSAAGGEDDIHQCKSHDAAVGIAARRIGYHCC